MFGLLIVAVSSFLTEIGDSIGKFEIQKRKASIFTVGFLNLFVSAIILIIIGLTRMDGFVFSPASLPFFLPRIVLEIAQAHVMLNAVAKAERSALCFIRTLTIPLLLLVDVILGYAIGFHQVLGIALIIVTLILLFVNHGFKKQGIYFALFTAVNAVATISLYKYDITHFNSIEAEQSIVMVILMAYLFGMAYAVKRENPLAFLKRPVFASESLSQGAAGAIISFAYAFAPASIIITATRSFDVLWAMVFGKKYFHEKHFGVKAAAFVFIVAGLVLLALK
jgi:hypothetical protein